MPVARYRWRSSMKKISDRSVLATIVGYTLVSIPGAIFGAALGFWLVVDAQNPVVFFGVIAASVLCFAALSVRFGMEFWEHVGRMRWLP
mgnify:CR=1 FL=1